MGKFKVGDKVRFLSSSGCGIIRSFAATNVANVEDESGFEIPTMLSDLIPYYLPEAEGTIFATEKQDTQPSLKEEKTSRVSSHEQEIPAETEPLDNRISPLYLNKLRNKTSEGVYLCFVPHEQRWLVYGDIDVYVVNFTPHRIIYSLLLAKEGCGFVSQEFSSLEAEEKVLIDTISREQIDSWKKGCMQLLFHDDKMQNVLLPINCELKVRTNRFFTEGSFIENAFFAEKAIVYPLCTMLSVGVFMQGEVAETEECKDKSEEPIVETIYKNVTDTFLHKHLSGRSTAEVDLHINELVEDAASLSPERILQLQLHYATKCLNEAIIENVNTIIFIHGVGQGVLKRELCKELDKYKGLHYFDAPMAKYGVGATQVYIGTNFEKVR